MTMDLNTLGVTQEELRTLVVNKLAAKYWADAETGEPDEEGYRASIEDRLIQTMDKRMRKAVEEAVSKVVAVHVGPAVAALVENTQFQEHTRYGEPKSGPMSWKEFLEKTAKNYMLEEVDSRGRSGSNMDGYGRTTRVAQMVYEYIGISIKTKVAEIVKTANASLTEGLKKAVDMKLDAILAGVKWGADQAK